MTLMTAGYAATTNAGETVFSACPSWARSVEADGWTVAQTFVFGPRHDVITCQHCTPTNSAESENTMSALENDRMEALRALIGRVESGWIVDVTNHDYTKSSGTRVVTRLFDAPDQTYRHEGETHLISKGGPAYMSRETSGAKQEFRYQWPVDGDDFEVKGNTLRVYNPSHAYVNGNRAIVLTLTFRPASQY